MLKTSKEWLIKQRLFIEIGMLSCLILSIVGTSFMFFRNADPVEEPSAMMSYLESESNTSIDSTQIKQISESQTEKIYVDVKGSVYLPGVYEVTSDMRLIDAINLAGGFSEKANQKPVNLSLKLTDQMVIFIPEIGETDIDEPFQESSAVSLEENVVTVPEDTEKLTDSTKVNINLADAIELQQLSGIGEKKAEQIVIYRQENGSFQTIEDLKNVSGIGEKTFEALKASVTVGNE
ncbi:helix-hairpin-helix domain-containing protein [Carnobacterium pleistocenium]|uniref:helix-hairpin-helix domain-containing protein n=1 Tax=Carnobacterium pleistocenium TaxID=181073 RepID=UPI0005502129|nr:helix-hairpin-helix domain-containing protein [Carnobacterium pleistocenium]